MKKTLFASTLSAVLLSSGGAFANTGVENYDKEHSEIPLKVYGQYDPGDYVHGANLHVFEKEDAEHSDLFEVYGGCGEQTYENTIIMEGGIVRDVLIGGEAQWDSHHNKVVVTSGKVGEVYGGRGYRCYENEIIVAGGEFREIYGGYSENSVSNNTIHLVGEGFSGNVGGVEVTGSKIETDIIVVDALEGQHVHSGTINIYGTGISIGRNIDEFANLNIHLMSGQEKGNEPMIVMSNSILYLGNVELTFDAAGLMDWKPGDTVTLAEAAQKQVYLSKEQLGKEYDIYRYVDKNDAKTLEQAELLATAHLVLEQDNKVLKLVVDTVVPEPATGTLSLLALAGLCARRRRK